jgi:hypothetical protein
MTGYVLRRLATVLLILVAMSLVFLATHALPSSPAALILGQYSTPETLAALEHKLGLDLPLPLQYWRWASGLMQGDMGQSLVMGGQSANAVGRVRSLRALRSLPWPWSRPWGRHGRGGGGVAGALAGPCGVGVRLSASRCRNSTGALC